VVARERVRRHTFESQLVDLVHHVQTRAVDAVALDHINQIIGRGVGTQTHVGVVDLVLATDGLDGVGVEMRRRHGRCKVDAALLLAAERQVRRLLVQADTKALQLTLPHGR